MDSTPTTLRMGSLSDPEDDEEGRNGDAISQYITSMTQGMGADPNGGSSSLSPASHSAAAEERAELQRQEWLHLYHNVFANGGGGLSDERIQGIAKERPQAVQALMASEYRGFTPIHYRVYKLLRGGKGIEGGAEAAAAAEEAAAMAGPPQAEGAAIEGGGVSRAASTAASRAAALRAAAAGVRGSSMRMNEVLSRALRMQLQSDQ